MVTTIYLICWSLWNLVMRLISSYWLILSGNFVDTDLIYRRKLPRKFVGNDIIVCDVKMFCENQIHSVISLLYGSCCLLHGWTKYWFLEIMNGRCWSFLYVSSLYHSPWTAVFKSKPYRFRDVEHCDKDR